MGWHLGPILDLFWRSWGGLGRLFWALGVPLGAFGAQPLPKTRGSFRGPPFLRDFGAKMGSKKGGKMHQKIDPKVMNFYMHFRMDFGCQNKAKIDAKTSSKMD